MITVQWNRVPNAVSYNIYRSEYSSGASSYFLGSVYGNQTQYRNTVSEAEQGKEFYYSVYAINSSGNTSIAGNLAMGYALANGSPGIPANVRLAAGSGRGNSVGEIKIEWDASQDNGAYYAVYRYSSNDSSLTRLTEKTTDPWWVDTTQLKPGLFYYYQVQTIVEDGEKVLKSQISTDIVEGYILSPPITVSAKKTDGGSISVIWIPAIGSETEQDTYTYRIYADNALAGSFSNEVASVSAPAFIQNDGFIHADNLPVYTFYKVVTVNAGSVESSPSETVSPPPAASVIQAATKAAFIAGWDANASGIYPVQVTWKKPNTETPASYHVYRSTRPDTGFRKITDTPVDASSENGGVFTYTDINETAKTGKFYYYKVLSLNILGQGAYYSDTVSGYGALTYEQYMIEFNKTVKASHKKLTLMHKANDLDKLGSESVNGALSGTLRYNAKTQGLGARITMDYTNYTEFYIENDSSLGWYFSVTGSTNTSANMSANGSMDGTMVCTGMYPGKVYYDAIEIKGGSAAGGTYGIEPDGFSRGSVSWTVGEK
jgi:fibronectin type 3 domain-containing protein